MEFHSFHPDKASVVAVEGLNRSSSIFLNCILDGHPQIINSFTHAYPDIRTKLSADKAAKFAYHELVRGLFWQEFSEFDYPFSYAEFRKLFLVYIREFGVSNKTVFLGMNYATAMLLGKDISKIKWIVYHSHADPILVARAHHDFKRYKMILTVRDPRASSWSYKKGQSMPIYATMFDAQFFHWLFHKLDKETIVIRHEDIHGKYPMVRRRICRFLGVKSHPSLAQATVFGKPWTGAGKKGTLSTHKATSSKPSKQFLNDNWKQGLGRSELVMLQTLMAGFLKRFGYKPYSKKGGSTATIDHAELLRQRLIFLRPHDVVIVNGYNAINKVPLIKYVGRGVVHVLTMLQITHSHAKQYRDFMRNK